MVKRKSISKKMRFEVFKRDSFRCQYCGATSPDVLLHVDHIKPVKEGGETTIENLITSCIDCNLGKGARLLDDNSVLEKQRRQLEELNERRQQLEMMMKWREGLNKLSEDTYGKAAEYWESKASCTLTDQGAEKLKKAIKKYSLQVVLDSIDDSCAQYLVSDNSGYTTESIEKAFNYIGKVAHIKTIEGEKPYIKSLFYIRGILRNRLNYCNQSMAIDLLERAYLEGASIQSLKQLALEVRNWTQWQDAMEEFLEGE